MDRMDGDHDSAGAFVRALLAPFVAVLGVTVVLTALYVWVGPDRGTDVLSAREAPSTSAAAQPSPTASSDGAQPSSPAPSASPAPSSPSPQPSPSEPSESPEPDRPQVVVLNQSGGGGLAREVADRISAAGWDVFKTGSFNGTVRTTTVYHPAGLRADARALAKDLPGTPRVLERFSNLSDSRLTIVLTDDYGS
jgi:hypothetical protein